MNSNLILGTVQFGMKYGINNRHGKPSSEEVNDILKCAFQNKVYYLDTADNYGESQNELEISIQILKGSLILYQNLISMKKIF